MQPPSEQHSAAAPPACQTVHVDISDLRVSDAPDAMLVAHSLGSCIAVVVYDPSRAVAGLLHYMLPSAKTSPEKSRERPGMFADTGIPLLFKRVFEFGSKKRDLIVKVAGGGTLFDLSGAYDIGKRNHMILQQIFEKNSIPVTAEDVGGTRSRSISVHVGSGRVIVTSRGTETEL